MNKLTIKTNNQYRPIIYSYELTASELKDFDYLDHSELCEASFFRYKGRVYDLAQFMRLTSFTDGKMKNWDGYHSASYFSGVLIKFNKCGDMVKVATYYS